MAIIDKYALDTSILLEDISILKKIIKTNLIIINIKVIEELDHINKGSNRTLSFKARTALKAINSISINENFSYCNNIDIVEVLDNTSYNLNDNIIVSSAFNHKAKLLTNDLNMKLKAESLGLECILHFKPDEDNYLGYKELTPTHEDLSYLYSNMKENIYNCYINEYLLLKDLNNIVIDILKWNGKEYKKIKYSNINSITPRNINQKLAFDLLQNKDTTIKVLQGAWGSGKDFLMIAHALKLIKDGKFDSIMWVRNNIELKDTKPIGFLPNGENDKLLPFAMVMADHVGGVKKLQELIHDNKIQLEHLGFMRGRDLKKCIVICSEAENMTKDHIQLLISRIGEDSQLWLNGDLKQIDDKIFEENNGLSQAINSLKGQRLFGYVKLNETERSETAKLASLLDDGMEGN